MSSVQTYFRFSLLVALGVVVFAAAYVGLGRAAAVFFGFVYIIATPLLYEVIERTPKLSARGDSM